MASSEPRRTESPETLAALAFAGFHPLAEPPQKTVLTTCLPTVKKNFESREFRAIIKTIKYPGVAELVPRHIWDVEIARSNRVTRTKKTSEIG